MSRSKPRKSNLQKSKPQRGNIQVRVSIRQNVKPRKTTLYEVYSYQRGRWVYEAEENKLATARRRAKSLAKRGTPARVIKTICGDSAARSEIIYRVEAQPKRVSWYEVWRLDGRGRWGFYNTCASRSEAIAEARGLDTARILFKRLN